VVAGYALATWLPRAALQLTVGTLLLIFGMQWLRTAILRSSGRNGKHDEDEIFQQRIEAARTRRCWWSPPARSPVHRWPRCRRTLSSTASV
jgi:uncharacterized membrane protein